MDDHHITLDLDWCSDDTLEYVAGIVRQARRRVTWFVTHASPAVEGLSALSSWEIGLHPNFLPGSTHGATPLEVFKHVTALFPGAAVMRSHGLFQSSPLLHMAATDFSIHTDVSLLLPYHPHLEVLEPIAFGGRELVRVPYYWEDDVEMVSAASPFDFRDPRHHRPGLKIYDFHPVHVAMNTACFDDYQRLKAKRPIPEWDGRFIRENQRRGRGALSFFEDMLATVQGETTISGITARSSA